MDSSKPTDKDRCKKKVYPSDMWGGFHGHQCHRKIWKDGYCKQHHPNTVKARMDTRDKRWAEEAKQRKATFTQEANEERQKMLDELAHDAFDHFKRAEILNEMRIKDYIEQWKPRGMI